MLLDLDLSLAAAATMRAGGSQFEAYPYTGAAYVLALPFREAWRYAGPYKVGATQYEALADLPGYSFARAGAKYEMDAADRTPLLFASGAPGLVPGVGYWARIATTNILLNAGTDAELADQSVTVTATSYTISWLGASSMGLTGTHTAGPNGTGTSHRNTYTFTPTAGTLNVNAGTSSGICRFGSLVARAIPGPIIPTAGSAVTLPADGLAATVDLTTEQDFIFYVIADASLATAEGTDDWFASLVNSAVPGTRIGLIRFSNVDFRAHTTITGGSPVTQVFSAGAGGAGRTVIMGVRRGTDMLCASKNSDGLITIGAAAARDWVPGLNQIRPGSTGTATGQPDSPVEGIFIEIGTFNDAAITAKLQGLGQTTLRGAWTWYNDPRVLRLSDTHFIVGGVNKKGDIVVDNRVSGILSTQTLSAALQIDDHANPALIRRASDGKLLAFYSAHNGADYWVALSTNADDGSAWGTAANIDSQLGHSGYSYANIFQLASGRFVLFYRATNTTTSDVAWHYSYTDDAGGLTGWVTGVQLSDGVRPYHKFRKTAAGRIDIIRDLGHPNLQAANSIYHFYMLDTAGTITFHDSDGTDIGSPPFAGADASLVYDGTPARAWVHDVVRPSTHPVAAFAVFPGSTDTLADDHRYYQGRFNGTTWATEEICTAGGDLYNTEFSGEDFYSGGVITDPTNADIVYCSRQVDSDGAIDNAGTHHIFKAERVSEGNWTLTQLTSGYDKCFRPFIPEGSRKLFFVKGKYTTYTIFNSTIDSLDID